MRTFVSVEICLHELQGYKITVTLIEIAVKQQALFFYTEPWHGIQDEATPE